MSRYWFVVVAGLALATIPAFAADKPDATGEPTGVSPPPAKVGRSGDRAVTVYGGFSSDNKLMRLLLTPWDGEIEGDIPWLGIGVSQRIGTFGDHFSFEVEGGTGYRFGSEKTGEFWTALYARYDGLPWNDIVYTTVAASTGVNLATRISPIEQTKAKGGSSKLLHYFSPEITFADPDNKELELALRLHHRSGVFGLFDGASSGSNIVTLGVRKHF